MMTATVTSIQLFLAIETNQDIAQQVREKKNSAEGLSVLMPYVYGNKINLAAGSVSVSLKYSRANGLKLLKIYHMLSSNTETNGTVSYNTSNVAQAELTDFYSNLNNNRLQQFNVTCANGEDWMLLKNLLKGSLYVSQNVYKYNWVWIDDFSGSISPLNESPVPDTDNFMKGIDLSSEQKWDIFMTTAAQLNHFTFSICQKMLVVNSSGIQIM